jgi:hypothetical protein
LIDSTKGFFYSVLFTAFFLTSCSARYSVYKKEYATQLTTADSIPNYEDLRFWAAHPWKKDPSDSIPKPLRYESRDSSADVFFIHPTTLTARQLEGVVWNASINDAAINAKTDYTSILYQASVFNRNSRVFAPRYRQAHLYSFYTDNNIAAKAALDLAYEDVKAAFVYYLKHLNNNRPIIIASHSQGTLHAGRILKEFFEANRLKEKLVCAYIVGLSVPKGYFTYLKPCVDSTDIQCFVTWRTFREGYLPDYVKKENGACWVMNPLTWTMSDTAISRRENKGAVLLKFNKPYKHTNGARIVNGALWINKPKFPLGFFLKAKNYHAGDFNLFYYSVRTNVSQRINAYFKEKQN